MGSLDLIDTEGHMLKDPCGDRHLLVFLTIGDIGCDLRDRIRLSIHEPELKRLITHQHRHGLNRDRIDPVGEVVEARIHEIIQHLDGLLGITESALGEAEGILVHFLDQDINVIDLLHLR